MILNNFISLTQHKEDFHQFQSNRKVWERENINLFRSFLKCDYNRYPVVQ